MDALHYEQLSTAHDVSGFHCGDAEWQRDVADFLIDDALAQQELGLNKTFLFLNDASEIVGYTTLLAWKLELDADPARLLSHPGISESSDSGRKAFPAMLIAQFGIDAAHQRSGYGAEIADWTRGHALDLEVGIRFLTLHVDRQNQAARRFWENQGFVRSRASGSTVLFYWSDLLDV